MKKLFWVLIILSFLAYPVPSQAVTHVFTATCLTGGTTGCLDAIECNDFRGDNSNDDYLATGDVAFVVDSSSNMSVYRFDLTENDAEDGSYYTIIVPDTRSSCSTPDYGQWERIEDFWSNTSLTLYDGTANKMVFSIESALGADKTWEFPGVGSANQLMKSDGDGTFSWATAGTDYVKDQLVSNTDQIEKVLYDDYHTCTESGTGWTAGVVALATTGPKIYMNDSDDQISSTDCDQLACSGRQAINDLTGLVSGGGPYEFVFEDECWYVDFSVTDLVGHNGIDWCPSAGDKMTCDAISASVVHCVVSRPTALDVVMYYDMPVDSTPDADDRWHGPTAEFLAGEALNQWDLVFVHHDTGTPELRKWHKDLEGDCSAADTPWDCCTGTDAGLCDQVKPIGVVIESGGISDTSTGTVGIAWGVGRNDGWTFTDAEHEGHTVYGTTAGAYSITQPSTSTEIVCAIGTLLDEDEILFNFGLCANVEVP